MLRADHNEGGDARPLILGLITLRWGRFITLKAAWRLGGRD